MNKLEYRSRLVSFTVANPPYSFTISQFLFIVLALIKAILQIHLGIICLYVLRLKAVIPRKEQVVKLFVLN